MWYAVACVGWMVLTRNNRCTQNDFTTGRKEMKNNQTVQWIFLRPYTLERWGKGEREVVGLYSVQRCFRLHLPFSPIVGFNFSAGNILYDGLFINFSLSNKHCNAVLYYY